MNLADYIRGSLSMFFFKRANLGELNPQELSKLEEFYNAGYSPSGRTTPLKLGYRYLGQSQHRLTLGVYGLQPWDCHLYLVAVDPAGFVEVTKAPPAG